MAIAFRTTNCLSQLFTELQRRKVTVIKSLDAIIAIQDNQDNLEPTVKEVAKDLFFTNMSNVERDLNILSDAHTFVASEIDRILSQKTSNPLKKLLDAIRLRKFGYDLRSYERRIADTKQKLWYLNENTDYLIEKTFNIAMKQIPTILSIIKDNGMIVAGAIGEEQAVDELRKLPDSFHIFNDFRYDLAKPIRGRGVNDPKIKSIQVDHLVVGPSGVFIIETKNWSSESIQNLDLFSPIRQIDRHNKALYHLLNKELSSLPSFQHHWGTIKISPHNILLMINAKPKGQFQHIRICSLSDIRSYITNSYFAETLDINQSLELSGFLYSICKAN